MRSNTLPGDTACIEQQGATHYRTAMVCSQDTQVCPDVHGRAQPTDKAKRKNKTKSWPPRPPGGPSWPAPRPLVACSQAAFPPPMQAEVASDSAKSWHKGEGPDDRAQVGSQLHEARRANPRRPPRAPRYGRGTRSQGNTCTVGGTHPPRAASVACSQAAAALASSAARTHRAAAPVSVAARAGVAAALASAAVRTHAAAVLAVGAAPTRAAAAAAPVARTSLAAVPVPSTMCTRATATVPAEDVTTRSGGGS